MNIENQNKPPIHERVFGAKRVSTNPNLNVLAKKEIQLSDVLEIRNKTTKKTNMNLSRSANKKQGPIIGA